MEKDYLITIRGTVEQTFHIKADNLEDAEKYTEEVTSAAWADWDGK